MTTRITTIILLLVITASIVSGIILYPMLSDTLVSHWSVEGQPNGTLSKFWALFMTPLILVVLFIFYIFIPKIDPLKKNIEAFISYYNVFWIIISAFLLYIHVLTIVWNFGFRFNLVLAIVPAISVVWYSIGMLLEKSKRNWFIGIRTPWTLASDSVWEKTNHLGAELFKITGIALLFGLFIGSGFLLFSFIIFSAIGIAITTAVYSYLEFRKNEALIGKK